MKTDQIVLGFSVVAITALSVVVFLPPCAARRAASRGGPFPATGETVAYGEFSNDGSLWRGRVYRFDGHAWTGPRTCYPSTGKGCAPGWSEVVYPPAASVAGRQRTELNSDRHGFLRGTHPKSRFEDAPALWRRVEEITRSGRPGTPPTSPPA